MKKLLIDASNIYQYNVGDRDLIFANSRKYIKGMPALWPTKSIMGRSIILSFVNATIVDEHNQPVHAEPANFDILEEDSFDQKDPLALTKIEFIDALLTPNLLIRGGVYYKGKYYTAKMTHTKAIFLLKSFLNSYFHLEDSNLIEKYFVNFTSPHLPVWPTKSVTGDSTVIFAAVNATIFDKLTPEKAAVGPINFYIQKGDIFRFEKKEDLEKIDVIFSLLSKDKIVDGFYYKGRLLPKSLSKEFKLYLEKSFIKKNFVIEDVDKLSKLATIDKETGHMLFSPMQDSSGRSIVASVYEASGSLIDDESKFANFHLYEDEEFDLRNPDFERKLEIIKDLFYKEGKCHGVLYLDGMVIPGNESQSECLRRKEKVERALKIYISDSKDFAQINKYFTIENRNQLINIGNSYNKFYPGNKVEINNKDKYYDKDSGIVLRIVDANAIDEFGNYIFEKNINDEVYVDEKITKPELIELFKHIFNQGRKVRGAVYFHGKNIAQSLHLSRFEDYLKTVLSSEDLSSIEEYKKQTFYQYELNRKSGMPEFWPTRDKNDREVLLSVVDADVRFKNGRTVVKAVTDANFDIYEGETFGLVGESGSGKTTISRAILGINKLAKGGIYFKGKLISSGLSKRESHANKKNIQMIFQDPAASLNERANVDYIISEGLYNFHLFKSKEERIEKVVSMLNQVGLLPEHLSRFPHEFSGGQRQRIGIARALVIEPQLVLADEPISALDVSIRAQVLNLLKKLQREQGLTYLFIAHDLSIIRYISDRIAVMNNGYIVELGPADEIYSHPLHPYTQSLLTAIPQPDPRSKNDRKKVRFEQGDLDYSKCLWEEFRPGHFVLVNDDLREKVRAQVAEIK